MRRSVVALTAPDVSKYVYRVQVYIPYIYYNCERSTVLVYFTVELVLSNFTYSTVGTFLSIAKFCVNAT